MPKTKRMNLLWQTITMINSQGPLTFFFNRISLHNAICSTRKYRQGLIANVLSHTTPAITLHLDPSAVVVVGRMHMPFQDLIKISIPQVTIPSPKRTKTLNINISNGPKPHGTDSFKQKPQNILKRH